MKVKVTHTFVYDTKDKQFWDEFEGYQGDHPLTFDALREFIIDRFINPNFDMSGTTIIEVVKP